MIGRKNLIKQRVRYVDLESKSALVLNRKGKAYPVALSDKVIYEGIKEKDIAHIRIINGTWIIVDFERYTPPTQDDFDIAEFLGEY